MSCWDRCKTDAYDSVVRRIEEAENKNLDQDNAISEIRRTMPDAIVVDGLEANVSTLQKEKLDNTHMDEDIHFGPVTLTKDGTAVITSFDAINPVTGAVTPLSFTLPGATSTDAGVMDASSVAWITEAEARISVLEGLSDVKALVGLNATPTQAEINAGWMGEVGKAPETGDLVQDVSNSKLWVYVTDTWILYGTLVVVPLATTGALGGIRDTALDAPANRWYGHVEADGRLSLIGGDALSTLLDTTIPAMDANTVKKTGNEDIAGTKNFLNDIYVGQGTGRGRSVRFINDNIGATYDDIVSGMTGIVGGLSARPSVGSNTHVLTYHTSDSNSSINQTVRRPNRDNVLKGAESRLYIDSDGEGWMTAPMRASPESTDAVNYRRLLDAYTEMVGYVNDQDALKANKTEVIDGLALKADVSTWTYGSGTLTTNAGTCPYNYAYYVIGDVVTMRFIVGPSTDTQFNVPLPVGVASAGVQCIGISNNVTFWVDYNGGPTNTIGVNRHQTTPQDRSFQMMVIGQPTVD